MDLAVSRWQSDGQDVLYVSDARTEQEVGRYDQRAGRLAVGDQTRVYEVVQALWAFLGGVADTTQEQEKEKAQERHQEQDPGQDRDRDRGQQREREQQQEREQGRVRVDEPRPAAAWCPDIDGHLLGLRTASPIREAGAKTRNARIVDRRLGKLRRDGWAVLSSVGERTGADFDRLVIGPPGVFAITVKHDDDVALPYLSDSLHDSRQDARSAARRLSVASGMAVKVTPMLAFLGNGNSNGNGNGNGNGDSSGGSGGSSGGGDSGGGKGGGHDCGARGGGGGDGAAERGPQAARDGRQGHEDEDAVEVLVARGEYLDDVLRELPAVYSLEERLRILDVARRAELWLATNY